MNTKLDTSDTGGIEQPDNVNLGEPSLGDIPVKREVQDQHVKIKVGDCHIFDYQQFKREKLRLGSENDANRLEHDFKGLDFDVYRYLNLSKSDTMDALTKASKKEHSRSKYFVCCFLTHGCTGALCMQDCPVYIDDILQLFSQTSCSSLKGKPKIFVFQACRGSSCEEGIYESTDFGSSDADENFDYTDFLIINSTYEGTKSFKTLNLEDGTKNHGSYFIDEFCRSLEHFSNEKDLLQILTIVNYRVAIFFKSRTEEDETNKKKQMPCITSRLRTEVKFNKKIETFESEHTRHFDFRREQHPLGVKSMQNPSMDHQLYHIPSSENIQFLSILNTNGNLGTQLNYFASKLWSGIADKNYQRVEKKNFKRTELENYLKTFAGGTFANVNCLICFVAGCAKGDYLFDSRNKKFFKRNLIEQFVGKNCVNLVMKPKIFIFLLLPQIKPKKSSWIPCITDSPDACDVDGVDDGSVDDTDDDVESSPRNFIPVHADILEVTITIKDTETMKATMDKLTSILTENKFREDLLHSLTKMNNELVKDNDKDNVTDDKGYKGHSLTERNISFSFHSTLTKTIKLP